MLRAFLWLGLTETGGMILFQTCNVLNFGPSFLYPLSSFFNEVSSCSCPFCSCSFSFRLESKRSEDISLDIKDVRCFYNIPLISS